MPRRNIPRSDRACYYLGAANFWFEAAHLQKARCQQPEKSGVESRADLNFYVVAVQRLLEVARMTRDRLGIREIGQAIESLTRDGPSLRSCETWRSTSLAPVWIHQWASRTSGTLSVTSCWAGMSTT